MILQKRNHSAIPYNLSVLLLNTCSKTSTHDINTKDKDYHIRTVLCYSNATTLYLFNVMYVHVSTRSAYLLHKVKHWDNSLLYIWHRNQFSVPGFVKAFRIR